MISEREHEFIMPVVLRKSGTHHEAIAAVATAVLQGCLSGPDANTWGAWFVSGQGKTVRRANEKDFQKVSARDDVLAASEVGAARALVFPPVLYTEMDKGLRRFQVGGTEFPRDPREAVAGVPTVVLNAGLGMSTGKSAAQAAHAMLAWWDSLSDEQREEWQEEPPREVNILEAETGEFERMAEEVDADLLIHDAGHTEIESGSATAFVI